MVRVRDVFLDRARAVVGQLDAVRLEPVEQALQVVLLELELLRELVELRQVDAAVLVAVLEQDARSGRRSSPSATPVAASVTAETD